MTSSSVLSDVTSDLSDDRAGAGEVGQRIYANIHTFYVRVIKEFQHLRLRARNYGDTADESVNPPKGDKSKPPPGFPFTSSRPCCGMLWRA